MHKPLDGIKVIDWTIWQLGPTAGVFLGDLGAEVIKVEQLGSGDPGRGVYTLGNVSTTGNTRANFYIEACNRHKKSIAVDLKKPEGREIVHRLVERSDVFVQNFRQGVAERLAMDYETLRALNPRLIYASGSGYGPEGPDSAEPAFDYLGQARSGFMYQVSAPEDALPCYVMGGVADQMGAIMMAYGVMAALVARERFGIGQRIDASHLGAMTVLQGLAVSAVGIAGRSMKPTLRGEVPNPLWNHYACQDGKWLALGMIQGDRYWRDLCQVLERPDLATDPHFADVHARSSNRKEAIAALDEAFRTRPRDYWLAALRANGNLIFTVVNRLDEALDDPQVVANGYVVPYEHPAYGPMRLLGMPIRMSETPGDARGRAPELGEHTEEILTGLLGYNWDDVERLRRSGAI